MLGKIEPGTEVRAMPMQHASLGFALCAVPNCIGQFLDKSIRDSVALVGAIQPDDSHIAFQLVSQVVQAFLPGELHETTIFGNCFHVN